MLQTGARVTGVTWDVRHDVWAETLKDLWS
jgi:hypothetical protein